MDNRHLFVYGTLRRNSSNPFAITLREQSEFVGEGKVQGRLYRIVNYAGLVPSNDNDRWVRGELYRLNDPEPMFLTLDAYEGCGPDDPRPHEFRRTILPVTLDSGDSISATVYTYALDVSGKQEIASGEFTDHTAVRVP